MDKRYSVILGILSFILITSGTFSPGWMVYIFDSIAGLFGHVGENSYPGLTIHQGIFLVVATSENETEVTSVYNFKDIGRDMYLDVLEYQIEACLGIFFCIFSIVCMFLYNETKDATYLYKPILFFLGAGVATWVAIGRWLRRLIPAGDIFEMKTPYSLILSGIGGVLCLVCTVLVIVLYRQDDRLKSPHTKVIYDPDPLPNLSSQNTQPEYSAVPPTEQHKL